MSVTFNTINTAIRDLKAQLEWIEDPMLRDYNTKLNKIEIKVLKRSILFLEQQKSILAKASIR